MSLENVKAFYEKLATDEAFRAQIKGVNSKAECSQIVKDAEFYFTQEEFERYTAQLLTPSAANNELQALEEKELEAVFGGASSIMEIQEPVGMQPYGLPPDLFRRSSFKL